MHNCLSSDKLYPFSHKLQIPFPEQLIQFFINSLHLEQSLWETDLSKDVIFYGQGIHELALA